MLKIADKRLVPQPVKEEKMATQIEINKPLMLAIDAELKRKGLKKRAIVEWGLKQWLVINNPKVAAQLGYLEDE